MSLCRVTDLETQDAELLSHWVHHTAFLSVKQATRGHNFNKCVTSSHRFTVMKTISMVHHSQRGFTPDSPFSLHAGHWSLWCFQGLAHSSLGSLSQDSPNSYFSSLRLVSFLSAPLKQSCSFPGLCVYKQQDHFACINLLSASSTSSPLEYEIYAFVVFRHHCKYLWKEGSGSSNFTNRVYKSQRLHSSKSSYGVKVDLY